MSGVEYEALRRILTGFAVLPGQAILAAEWIVEQDERFPIGESSAWPGSPQSSLTPRRR